MKARSSFLDYVLRDAMHGIPGVTAKAMFGGYGLYQDGVVFGIIADDELYFKVDDGSRAEYEKRGSRPFTYETKDRKKVAMSYWEVPAEVLEDRSLLSEWLHASVAVSRRMNKSKKKSKKKFIKRV